MGNNLININNMIWKYILNQSLIGKIAKLLPISETMLCILLISMLVGGGLGLFRYLVRDSDRAVLPIFGAKLGYLLSVHAMIDQLPLIHNRVNRALQSFVNVVQNYPDYTDIYMRQTGATELEPGSVAKYIYSLTKEQRIKEHDFLFSHVYQTLDQTKGIVDQVYPQIKIAVFLVVFICIILSILHCYRTEKSWYHRQSCLLILWGGLFLISAFGGLGLTVAFLTLWISECFIYRFMIAVFHENNQCTEKNSLA